MTSEKINPFIRRAFIHSRAPHNKTVKCADCRLFYILEGSGEVSVENIKYPIVPDSLFLWPSGTEYCFKLSKNTNCKLIIINFDYTEAFSNLGEIIPLILADEYSKRMPLDFDDFTDIKALNHPIILNNMQIFKHDLLGIISEFEAKKLYSDALISAALKQIIIRIARLVSAPPEAKSKIKPILEYIKLNYSGEITNSSLAAITNYHPNYVNLLMKSYMGTTLKAYVIDYRLSEALKLLLNTDASIEEIAYRTGFKNPTHFCNTFKKKYGSSPSLYRKITKTV